MIATLHLLWGRALKHTAPVKLRKMCCQSEASFSPGSRGKMHTSVLDVNGEGPTWNLGCIKPWSLQGKSAWVSCVCLSLWSPCKWSRFDAWAKEVWGYMVTVSSGLLQWQQMNRYRCVVYTTGNLQWIFYCEFCTAKWARAQDGDRPLHCYKEDAASQNVDTYVASLLQVPNICWSKDQRVKD